MEGVQCAQASAPPRATSTALITKADLQFFVVHLRERGVKPVSCNCWVRAMNAFCRWLHEQGEIPSLVKLPPQRLEKRMINTHGEAALRAILTYRPKSFSHRRVHALVSTILDAGCRIEEMLTARVTDFEFGNLLLTVCGKGRKERRVPFSTELRKALFRFGQFKERAGVRSDLMFPARRLYHFYDRAFTARRLNSATQWDDLVQAFAPGVPMHRRPFRSLGLDAGDVDFQFLLGDCRGRRAPRDPQNRRHRERQRRPGPGASAGRTPCRGPRPASRHRRTEG